MIWHVYDEHSAVLLENGAGRFSPRLVKRRSASTMTVIRLSESIQSLWFADSRQAIEAAIHGATQCEAEHSVLRVGRRAETAARRRGRRLVSVDAGTKFER